MSLLANEAQAAASAKRAYLAAQMASVKYFATAAQGTTGGLSATVNGDTFAVISADGAGAVLYRNSAGSAVPLDFSLIGSGALDTKADEAALVSAVSKRTESYVQSTEPDTAASALWFDTSAGFLTLKIQRGA